MRIKYEKKALKYLAKAEKKIASRIREAINGLTDTPPKGDIKPLEGYTDGRKRLKLGKYRVIFKYGEIIIRLEIPNAAGETEETVKILFIMNIGSRGDIYKED